MGRKKTVKYSPLTHNMWLVNLKEDIEQHKYSLKKAGLYSGGLKYGIEVIISSLKDYDL